MARTVSQQASCRQYYLLVCAGFFRSRQGQLWQLVLTHRGRQATYRSVRL